MSSLTFCKLNTVKIRRFAHIAYFACFRDCHLRILRVLRCIFYNKPPAMHLVPGGSIYKSQRKAPKTRVLTSRVCTLTTPEHTLEGDKLVHDRADQNSKLGNVTFNCDHYQKHRKLHMTEINDISVWFSLKLGSILS